MESSVHSENRVLARYNTLRWETNLPIPSSRTNGGQRPTGTPGANWTPRARCGVLGWGALLGRHAIVPQPRSCSFLRCRREWEGAGIGLGEGAAAG